MSALVGLCFQDVIDNALNKDDLQVEDNFMANPLSTISAAGLKIGTFEDWESEIPESDDDANGTIWASLYLKQKVHGSWEFYRNHLFTEMVQVSLGDCGVYKESLDTVEFRAYKLGAKFYSRVIYGAGLADAVDNMGTISMQRNGSMTNIKVRKTIGYHPFLESQAEGMLRVVAEIGGGVVISIDAEELCVLDPCEDIIDTDLDFDDMSML